MSSHGSRDPKFSGQLQVEDTGDGRNYRLLKNLMYFSGPLRIVVPKGFETDYASVPRFLWNIIPPTGKYSRAAVVHDYLYRSQITSRVVADAIFYEAMRALGVTWRCWIMYMAVRLFGWKPYNSYKK